MTPLNEIAPQLQKLLLMLSSSRDDEVVNAARAIDRILRTVGADWHGLATGLLLPAKARAKTKPDASRDDSNKRWRAMAGHCLLHEERLSPRKRQFITSLLNWRGDLTPKQRDWLTAIYERLQRERASA